LKILTINLSIINYQNLHTNFFLFSFLLTEFTPMFLSLVSQTHTDKSKNKNNTAMLFSRNGRGETDKRKKRKTHTYTIKSMRKEKWW